jgi:hypothetical protein
MYDRLRVGSTDFRRVLRKQEMLKGHLPRVIYHPVHYFIRILLSSVRTRPNVRAKSRKKSECMAHIRQSKLDPGRGFQVQAHKTFQGIPLFARKRKGMKSAAHRNKS